MIVSFEGKDCFLDCGCIFSDEDFLDSVNGSCDCGVISVASLVVAGVKHVASTSTKGRSSMHAKRLFRMSCTWDYPSSVSTSNVLGVSLRLHLR